jgi:lysophospholipase L1-like esterase
MNNEKHHTRSFENMSKTRIAAFGDAVTMGTSAKLDVFHDCFQYGTTTVNMVRETQTWRSITERILTDWVEGDVEVINAGVAGEPSQKGLARMERDVLSQSPDIVLVMFGAEDALAGVEPAAFRENLKKIVEGIAARNARPVLMTPTPISERMTASGCTLTKVRRQQERLSDLAQAVRKLAEEKFLPLIDLNRTFLDTRLVYDHLYEGWLPDGVAQSGMASFVAGELLPMLSVKDFPKPILCDTRKVYSSAKHPAAKHNGFTDLTYFEGEFYVVFRSGVTHGTRGLLGGRTIVLRSPDGIAWVREATLQVEAFVETRDPKFLHVGDRLMVYAVSHELRGAAYGMIQYGFERLGPGKWSRPFECAPCTFWRPRRWRDHYVMAGYDGKFDGEGNCHLEVNLFWSADGRHWNKASPILDLSREGSETDLLVEDDRLMAFSRTKDESRDGMVIATYIPSENRWEAVPSGRLIHAPCVFKAGERTMVVGRYCSQSDERFRELRADWNAFNYGAESESLHVDPARIEAYHHGLRTGIFVMDGARPRLVMELLSGGDCGYPGVAQYGDEILISDYSMHEYYPRIERPGDWNTPCDIYVSRIRFKSRGSR